MLSVALLNPQGLRVICELGMVRNSIGEEAYVADEIIVAHSGRRVKIANTDAEGRLVLADLLSHLRERCLGDPANMPNPRIISIATLTGHAGLALGPYASCNDNGPSRQVGVSRMLQEKGELWGEPIEVSSLRKEDFDFVSPRNSTFDVLQSGLAPSSATARGHQFPMAFLSVASGLDAHGLNSPIPICYTHIDIAGATAENDDWQFGKPLGTPIVALAALFLEIGG